MGSPEIRGELRVNRGTGVPGIGSSKTNKGGCFSSVAKAIPASKAFRLDNWRAGDANQYFIGLRA